VLDFVSPRHYYDFTVQTEFQPNVQYICKWLLDHCNEKRNSLLFSSPWFRTLNLVMTELYFMSKNKNIQCCFDINFFMHLSKIFLG
jgi:hypothetical protein